VATLDDLFGKKTSGQRWMKFENEGEAFLLVQTDEPKRVPQRGPNGGITWLVQPAEGDKYKPVEADANFNESDYNNAFKPDGNIVIPARVLAKKLKDGSTDPAHEEFDTDWELTKDQVEKFRDAMLDSGASAEAGTRYAVKLLSRAKKPYTYSVKIVQA
jgi:hypothetical protein